MHRILINKTTEITGEPGKALLFVLKENHIFLPSACGGKGACGQCRVEAIRGFEDPYNPKEIFHIPPEERERNIRLACQHIIKGDIEIRIPDFLLGAKRYQARVAKIRDLTYDIKELTLEVLTPGGIEFTAGQFVQVEVPPYERSQETVFRAYSLASPPSSKTTIQLQVRYVQNGISTTYIHHYLKCGDILDFNGPFGMFHLREGDAEAIFIAGSTGLSPVRSILLDMKDKGIKRKTRFFFGAISRKDLFLVEEMKKLEEELPDFSFIPALSKPDPDDNWDGETGLITDVTAKYLDDNGKTEAYLCGSPAMINACIKLLKTHNFTEDRIFYDRFA